MKRATRVSLVGVVMGTDVSPVRVVMWHGSLAVGAAILQLENN